MRKTTIFAAILIAGLIAGACFAMPQQASTTPSLGDLARRLKAERDKGTTKPAKVYTNDNIPTSGGITTTETSAKGSTGEGETAESSEKPKPGAHDEKYYSEKMKELQSQKEMHQRELAVLQQKLNENQVQYYSDPNKALNQQYNPADYRSDINKKMDEIEKKKQQIEADDKAISDLQAQCQREGCPAGWVR